MLYVDVDRLFSTLGLPPRGDLGGEDVVAQLREAANYQDRVAEFTRREWNAQVKAWKPMELSALKRKLKDTGSEVPPGTDLKDLGYPQIVAEMACKPPIHLLLLEHRHAGYVQWEHDGDAFKHAPLVLDAAVAVAGYRRGVVAELLPRDVEVGCKPLAFLVSKYETRASPPPPAWEAWFSTPSNVLFTLECMKRVSSRIKAEFEANVRSGRDMLEIGAESLKRMDSTLMYVRMAITHPQELAKMSGVRSVTPLLATFNECIVCMEETDPGETSDFCCRTCFSTIHKSCMRKWVKALRCQGKKPSCPHCRAGLS